MSIILPELPENLRALDDKELRIQEQSIVLVKGDADSSYDLDMLHACMDRMMVFTHDVPSTTEDEVTISRLGARLFNCSVSALKLLLRGYYQVSFAVQRDLLEMTFLLDYFSLSPSDISVWRTASPAKRKKRFAPFRIREALDKRDGFVTRKRGAYYGMLSEYAAHATHEGMKLLAPRGRVVVGPFLDRGYLRKCLWELTRGAVLPALTLTGFFGDVPPQISRATDNFARDAQRWLKERVENRQAT